MNKKIIILVGDSWPHGEIDEVDNIFHGGMGEYLVDYGYDIRNLSFPSGSNLQAYTRLKHYLNCNKHELKYIKEVLFFKTEFFREIYFYKQVELQDELKKGYTQIKNDWANIPYYKLSELSQKTRIPISIIGGCSDALILPNEPPGVHVVCQSWSNYMISGNHLIDEPVLTEYINGWVDPFLNLVKPNMSNYDLNELNNDIELGTQRINKMYEYNQYFGPDPIHPNRLGHKMLFDFLIDKMNL